MKKQLLTLFCAAGLALSANAAIIQVDNNPSSPAPFTSVQAAADAAAHGDTIYVAGSPYSYGNVTVNDKAVHIIGIGYQPDKQNSLPTTLGLVTFGYNATGTPYTTASGSSIEGCLITNHLRITGNYSSSTGYTYIQGIIVKRCQLDYTCDIDYASNILIINNLGVAPDVYYVSNTIISNNLFTGYYASDPTNTNITVSNNLFLEGAYAISRPFNTNFINNIFVKNKVWHSLHGGNSSFNNNIFYCADNTLPAGSGSTNTFSNNLIGTNPMFINPASIPSPNTYDFTTTHDYHLSSGSSGKNAGTDGTDIGIYGGSYPWPDGGASGSGYMYSQEPNIPQVHQLDIPNTTVPQNGTLNVNVLGITNP